MTHRHTHSRRYFLRSAAIAGAGGALLAACGNDDDADDAAATGTETPTEATAAPEATAAGDIPAARIGYVTPRTGPLAPFGEADDFVLAQMRDALPDGVEILDRDSESDSSIAAEVAQELILTDGAEVVLVGGTPDTTVPVVNQCDLNETPCISNLAPWQPHYLGIGGELGPDIEPGVASQWNYHFFWGLEDVIEVFIGLWDAAGVAKVVGGLWPNDPDGNAWSDANVGFPPVLEGAGYEVVDPGRFPIGSNDFSAQINAFKDAGVEIVSGVLPPPDFANYQGQALQQDFNPPVDTVGKALLFPSAVETYPQPDLLSTEIWWSNRHPFSSSITGQTSAELAQAFEDATSSQWTQPLGFSHALFEVAVDALKRAGSADREALIGALGGTNLATIVGPVDFGSGPVPNFTKTPLVGGQWVAGQTYPFELAIVVNAQLPDVAVDGEMQLIS